MEPVSVKRPIQDKFVTRRQRPSRAGWWRIADVSRHVRRIELQIVWTGTHLETSSRLGLRYISREVSGQLEYWRPAQSLACQAGECSMRDGLHRNPPRDPG